VRFHAREWRGRWRERLLVFDGLAAGFSFVHQNFSVSNNHSSYPASSFNHANTTKGVYPRQGPEQETRFLLVARKSARLGVFLSR
jgi:hypothetical protein